MMIRAIALLVSLVRPASAGPLIEGADPKVLEEHRELLKSVVSLDARGTDPVTGKELREKCTATVIGRYTVLASQHCYLPGMKREVRINGERMNVVGNVVVTPSTSLERAGRRIVSDLLMARLKPRSCKENVLRDRRPIPPAARGAVFPSGRVLVAGFGTTMLDSLDAGELRAGYVTWALSPYSSAQPGLKEMVRALALKHGHGDLEAEMMAVARRTHEYHTHLSPGGTLDRPGPLQKRLYVQKNEAIVMKGDSGGPAIAFDRQGRPFVVGVASRLVVNIREEPLEDYGIRQNGKITHVRPVNDPEWFHAGIEQIGLYLAPVLNLLDAAGVIDPKAGEDGSRRVTKSFDFFFREHDLRAGLYSPLITAEGADWIQRARAELPPVPCE